MRLLPALALSSTLALVLAAGSDGRAPADRYLLDLAGDGADPAVRTGTDDGWLTLVPFTRIDGSTGEIARVP